MPIVPYTGMVDSAIRFKSQPALWVAIGRTTPWINEAKPPNENDFNTYPQFINMHQPDELIGFKRIEVAQLCVPDIDGEVRYKAPGGQIQRFKLIDDTEALDLMARWVYIRASFDYVERNSAGEGIIGFVTYRQTAIFSDLKVLKPYQEEIAVSPSQVETYPPDYPVERLRNKVKGRMVYYCNHHARERDVTMRDIIEIVREFRG